MPNTTISDDDIKNAILSTNGTGAYLIKIIQNNNVCAVLYGHNVSNNYRFYVAFSYYSIGSINRIKSFKYNINSWTIESYVTNSDLIAHYPKVLFFNIEANSYKIIKEQGTARFSQLVFLQAANTKGHGLYLLSGYGSDGGTTRYNISEIASGSQYNIEIINGTNFKITNSNNSTATVALAMFMGDNPIIE